MPITNPESSGMSYSAKSDVHGRIGRHGDCIAVMQPYFFPYIGYYQLAAAVDMFVLLDDVSYIKQGWINRNRFLLDGRPNWFTVPLSGAGSHELIRDVRLDVSRYRYWRAKFFKSLTHYYGHAPFYRQTLELIDRVVPATPGADTRIAALAECSLKQVLDYLGLPVRSRSSSLIPLPGSARGTARIFEICRQLGAHSYLNSPGGAQLYDRQAFAEQGIALAFVMPGKIAMEGSRAPDGSPLSILHTLMRHDVMAVRAMLNDCRVE
jgi:hypothetical protein